MHYLPILDYNERGKKTSKTYLSDGKLILLRIVLHFDTVCFSKKKNVDSTLAHNKGRNAVIERIMNTLKKRIHMFCTEPLC